jgi:ubiquinone/menaquinone biosynthesis C-methylase UbiE
MNEQSIFKQHARYYDLLYSWKDYKKEADKVLRLIRRHKKSAGNDLLEVACGTGKHTQYLTKHFSVVATDVNDGMLRIARENCKGATFKRANMITLDLGKEFDVITCLFSSIGYVKTDANLRKTIRNFGRHLKSGGVLILEPWFTKSDFRVGEPGLTIHDGPDVKVARLFVSEVRGDLSIMDMHYVVAERGRRVKHYVDRHELGLFERRRTLAHMRRAGLKSSFRKDGLMPGRGLFIGVKG